MKLDDLNLKFDFDTMNLINTQELKTTLHDDVLNEIFNIEEFVIVREKNRFKNLLNKKKQQTFDNNIRREFFDFEITQTKQIFVATTQIFIIEIFNN